MIGFRNQTELAAEVAEGLVHETAPSSYNIILPPGFGEDALADQISQRLRAMEPRPLVAVLSSDTVRSVNSYITRLHAQWSETLSIPDVRTNVEADAALKQLLHSLPPSRPTVQIIKRFHKILDSLDRFVLGALREAENLAKLRTVTISLFGYDHLKTRWEHAGRLLLASDYGDTHSVRDIEPLSAPDIIAALRTSGRAPPHVVELAISLTGGYPEPFQAVIERWIRMDKPELLPEVRRALRAEAEQRMRRLVKKLDLPNERRYRDLVVDLHQGVDVENALHLLAHHPWQAVLVGDGGLRAEAIGDAAVSVTIEDAVREQQEGSVPATVLKRARLLYERKQYAATVRLLDAVERPTTPDELKLIHAHARVMAILYADGAGEAGVDTDWGKLKKSVDRARGVLALQSSRIGSASQVEERYLDLESLADRIQRATRDGGPRVVDVLSGFRSGAADARAALLLLVLKIQAGCALAGNASACQCVLALPEQLFRIWALWALKLDFYQAPADADDTWRCAEGAWPHGLLTRTEPGAQFGSFESFTYFALSRFRDGEAKARSAPEPDFKSLARALSVLSIRRDSAHAITLANAKMRLQLFQLIERWFEALLAPCLAHEGFTRDELFAQIEPLPIVDGDGSLLWLA